MGLLERLASVYRVSLHDLSKWQRCKHCRWPVVPHVQHNSHLENNAKVTCTAYRDVYEEDHQLWCHPCEDLRFRASAYARDGANERDLYLSIANNPKSYSPTDVLSHGFDKDEDHEGGNLENTPHSISRDRDRLAKGTDVGGAERDLVANLRHRTAWRDLLVDRTASIPDTLHEGDVGNLSAALSFPLTLARGLRLLRLYRQDQRRGTESRASEEVQWEPKVTLKVDVIGARAEAMNKQDYLWGELLKAGWSSLWSPSLDSTISLDDASKVGQISENFMQRPARLEISLYGPSVTPGRGPTLDAFRESFSCDLKVLRHQGFYHDHHPPPNLRNEVECFDGNSGKEAQPDLCVLFNPGLGEPGWSESWIPTLRSVRSHGCPVLLTALSEQDAIADASFLQEWNPTAWLWAQARTHLSVISTHRSLVPFPSPNSSRWSQSPCYFHNPAASLLKDPRTLTDLNDLAQGNSLMALLIPNGDMNL